MNVAGAPLKSAPVTLSSERIDRGVWREVRSDGSVWIVCDLTSALWQHKPPRQDKRR